MKEYYRPQVPHADDNAIVVKNIPYTKLETVGRGGSSEVFKVVLHQKQLFGYIFCPLLIVQVSRETLLPKVKSGYNEISVLSGSL